MHPSRRDCFTLPFVVIFTCLRILAVHEVDIDINHVNRDRPWILQHWTAPSIASYENRTITNPVSLFHFSVRSRPTLLKYYITEKNQTLQICLIALLAGDIEPNPGPRPLKYPCQMCNKAAKWGQKAIECEHCNGWFHTSCLNMDDDMYNILCDHPCILLLVV